MNAILTRSSTLLAAAILTACVAQRDTPVEPCSHTQTAANSAAVSSPPPPMLPERSDKAELEPAMAREEVSLDTAALQPSAPMEARMVSAVGVSKQVAQACCVNVPLAVNTEKYQHLDNNPVHLASEDPVSTFSIDVDTGSYTNVRRYLTAGQLPPQDAVRVEEMINYFDYEYAPPSDRTKPFQVSAQLAAAPWNAEALLLKIGIKGFEVSNAERPPANLVFLIDVSGSMQDPDKLPLLKNAFHLLTEQLDARDRVSIVVYAGNSGVVLPPTAGDHKRDILAALDRLEAGGSTNGAEGILRAYQLARSNFIKNGINRVVLATDGDFNVGVVNYEALIDMAERERASGVALTTLGFGTGNYNDQLMERLADAGNGNYAYVDNESEARKVLVSQLSGTLLTIAKDVKIQVEFNPAQVLEYRLIGYENRMLAREDFNNDKVDAGEIGAGHRVTALYEVIPVGAHGRIDPLRYGEASSAKNRSGELANVRLRFKRPEREDSELLEFPVQRSSQLAQNQLPADFKFAAGVAAFGQLLRGGQFIGNFGYQDIIALARDGRGADRQGYRQEFVSLVERAQALSPQPVQQVGRIEE
ncbi:MAG TPA: VWA domain-containing protein [Steroidobacteraceae bacterium]|nr:VWA domain-containing protein [Steroidobacteraceae bacterium]